VTFTWVKAHNGEQMNELVDALAVAASTAFRK
jgi:ribonuclease HI